MQAEFISHFSLEMKTISIMLVLGALGAVTGRTFSEKCLPYEFQCADGSCIPNWFVCDGQDDCGDMSDEQDCPACPPGTFSCSGGGCIPQQNICDGHADCHDWSDETEELCPCAENETRCNSPTGPPATVPGACILKEYVCDPDGIWDCFDGSDEKNCTAQVD